MKAIKGLVAFLGLLLVVGLGVLGYGLYTKAHQKGSAVAFTGPVQPVKVAEFGTVAVPVPAGARIEQMAVAGERVVLRLTGAGPERVVVLDPGLGKVTGAFVLAPEPAVR